MTYFRANERFDLSFSIIPSTLLIEAVLNENYDKKQRIDLLSFGFSIIYIYYQDLNEYTKEGKTLQSTSKQKGNGKCVTLFEKKFCQKYLALTASLICQISKKDSVDLGALGSHHLEHFFGNIRRLSQGNDTSNKFAKKCYDALLRQILSHGLNIDITEEKRVSSSGVFIEEQSEIVHSERFIDYLQVAWCLFAPFRENGEFFNQQVYQLATVDGSQIMSEEDAFEAIESILMSGQKKKNIKIISAKKEKMIIRSGLTNDKRLIEGQQIIKMKTRSQTNSTIEISIETKSVISEEESDDDE